MRVPITLTFMVHPDVFQQTDWRKQLGRMVADCIDEMDPPDGTLIESAVLEKSEEQGVCTVSSRVLHEERPKPILPGADLRPWTRQFTGINITRAYVVDHLRGDIVWACGHAHRSNKLAQRCADKATKRLSEEL